MAPLRLHGERHSYELVLSGLVVRRTLEDDTWELLDSSILIVIGGLQSK